jgi:hypothetical protein
MRCGVYKMGCSIECKFDTNLYIFNMLKSLYFYKLF